MSTIDVEKNDKEVIRIEISPYNGKELLHIRQWFRNEDGDLKPTQKGITVDVSKHGDILKALETIGKEVA